MAEAEPPLDFITNFFTDLSVSFFITYSFYMSEAQTVAAIISDRDRIFLNLFFGKSSSGCMALCSKEVESLPPSN